MTVYSKAVSFISYRKFNSKSGVPLCLITVLDDQKRTLEFFAKPELPVSGLEFGDSVLLTFDFNGRGLYLTNIDING